MRPMIAIVGRPNVGKSTLLNRLVGRRVAVVDNEPGVTRDRLFVDCKLLERDVILVDTGGLDVTPHDEIAESAVAHARLAVEEADFVLFVCDGKNGLHPLDHEVADILRKSNRPFVCVINKLDPGTDRDELEFHELGLDFHAISAAHGMGVEELLVKVEEYLNQTFPPVERDPNEQEHRLALCLLGRPNVGKSSLANQLSGLERQIVSDIAGTTRDAVDIPIESKGERYLLVDTPGMRRKSRISQRLEKYSVVAALRSIERAEVGVVVLDGSQAFSDQDARLLRLVHDRGRALVVLVNKCDLFRTKQEQKSYLQELAYGLRFVNYAPVIAISAKDGTGIQRILPSVHKAYQNASRKVGTGDLNRFLQDALEQHSPPVVKGHRGKLFYVTQTNLHPPTFVAWVNNPSKFSASYRKYLENSLRDRFDFSGTPIRLRFRPRGSGKKQKNKHK